MKFHELFKSRRMKIGTVREFAKKSGLDLAYVSRLENGIVLPPRDSEKLARLAMALGIIDGSEEWREFMDLAAVARNELPEDLQDDERIMAVLPAFYRALRNKDIDKDDIRRLFDMIQKTKEGE